MPGIDPVCSLHGKRMSDHPEGHCLYCCICFRPLTLEECARDSAGERWDMCEECARWEWPENELY